MPFNLLLLPLLGGYWLLRRCNRTRFLLARQDVQRVLLWSATAGFALLVLAALTTSGFIAALDALRRSGDESALSLWHGFSPFAHSGKAVLALLLGGFLPHAFNRAFWWKWDRPDIWARKATEFYGDETEALILRAQDFQMPILITLKTSKVYVGFVQHNLNPEVERRHLRLLPVVSGYRASEDRRVAFTTLYEQVRDEARQPDSPFHGLLDRDFEIVVPISEITTMSLFDFDAYEAFNRPKPAQKHCRAAKRARR